LREESLRAAQAVAALDEVTEACAGGPDLALGERLMRERRLGVFEIIDGERRVVTSGHLPARAGDPGLDAGGVRRLDVLKGDGIGSAVATVAGTRAGACTVWAGYLWDDARLASLSALAGARVELVEGTSAAPEGGPARRRAVALDDAGRFTLVAEVSDAPLRAAQVRILAALAALALLAGVAGLFAARALAGSIAGPVAALAEGARAIAGGNLDHRVEAPGAPSELARLVDAFNRMSQDLRRARERLASAERVAAWRDIARRLAHEIKNPLTPIRMSMETLRAARGDPRFAQVLEQSTGAVLEEVERLKKLAEEFAEFARMPRPQQREVDAGELMQAAAALYAGSLQVKVLAADGCPRLFVDHDQAVRALSNLIKNGLEAGAPVTVAARAGAAGEVVLEVRDSGPGVDPADVARLFTPYFTTKSEGTGLGLSIVHRVAEEHGGRVEVDPNPGRGAAFRLVLPAAPAAASAAPATT
jgi:signal transduction histidine kinase